VRLTVSLGLLGLLLGNTVVVCSRSVVIIVVVVGVRVRVAVVEVVVVAGEVEVWHLGNLRVLEIARLRTLGLVGDDTLMAGVLLHEIVSHPPACATKLNTLSQNSQQVDIADSAAAFRRLPDETFRFQMQTIRYDTIVCI